MFISKWISVHHRGKIATGEGLGIIYIGWVLGDDIRIPVNLPNDKDKVIIGILENVEQSWKLPIVGKVFGDTANIYKWKLREERVS